MIINKTLLKKRLDSVEDHPEDKIMMRELVAVSDVDHPVGKIMMLELEVDLVAVHQEVVTEEVILIKKVSQDQIVIENQENKVNQVLEVVSLEDLHVTMMKESLVVSVAVHQEVAEEVTEVVEEVTEEEEQEEVEPEVTEEVQDVIELLTLYTYKKFYIIINKNFNK